MNPKEKALDYLDITYGDCVGGNMEIVSLSNAQGAIDIALKEQRLQLTEQIHNRFYKPLHWLYFTDDKANTDESILEGFETFLDAVCSDICMDYEKKLKEQAKEIEQLNQFIADYDAPNQYDKGYDDGHKETAKEILQKVEDYFDDCILQKQLPELKKEYGVDE